MIDILFLHAGAEMYGADKVLLDLIRGLDKKRYQAHVVLPCEGVLVDALKRENIDVQVLPYPIMRRKYFTPSGVLKYGWNLVRYSHQLTQLAKRLHIDIVHTNTSAVLEGSWVAKRLKIPQLWAIHEIIVSPKIMFKATSWLISHFADMTVTVSKAAKKHLLESGYFKEKDIHVIYNGVDSARFNPNNTGEYLRKEWNIPDDALVVGMIGRINKWKGQHDFLTAMNQVLATHTNVYAVIVGSAFQGEEWRETELDEAIADSPFANCIIRSGYRADSESVHGLFDVFVLPSTNPDPFPTVVLEAMSTGKPIIGYRHGGVCEMVEEGYNGFLADVCNPKDLAYKINLLLNNAKTRKTMGYHSREHVLDCFSMKSYVAHYESEYDQLYVKQAKGTAE